MIFLQLLTEAAVISKRPGQGELNPIISCRLAVRRIEANNKKIGLKSLTKGHGTKAINASKSYTGSSFLSGCCCFASTNGFQKLSFAFSNLRIHTSQPLPRMRYDEKFLTSPSASKWSTHPRKCYNIKESKEAFCILRLFAETKSGHSLLGDQQLLSDRYLVALEEGRQARGSLLRGASSCCSEEKVERIYTVLVFISMRSLERIHTAIRLHVPVCVNRWRATEHMG